MMNNTDNNNNKNNKDFGEKNEKGKKKLKNMYLGTLLVFTRKDMLSFVIHAGRRHALATIRGVGERYEKGGERSRYRIPRG